MPKPLGAIMSLTQLRSPIYDTPQTPETGNLLRVPAQLCSCSWIYDTQRETIQSVAQEKGNVMMDSSAYQSLHPRKKHLINATL